MKKEFNSKDFSKAIDKSNLRGFQFKEKEFNLSEKIRHTRSATLGKNRSWKDNRADISIIRTKYVKEFIRLENVLLVFLKKETYTWEEFLEKRNKLAGENLR